MTEELKYCVKIHDSDKPLKVEKKLVESLKGAASAKMLRKMKTEFVDCPVLMGKQSFLACFACSNFLRRVKGEVHCLGLPIEQSRSATL